MKRIIFMLLIACSAITTASADPTATPQKKPESVIQSLEGVIAFYAEEGSQTLSVTKNPETGLTESSERIAPFTCKKEDLWNIPIGFEHDEPLSYQYMHLLPGNTELFNLKVLTDNGQKSKDIRIRTNSKQEMWFLCCKNPDNPQLRDAYAIVWEDAGSKKVVGTVYMITSLRPDLYEKKMVSAGLLSDNKNTFTIDGRVGYDLTDSLYVVYMADTAEELNNVKDSDFVATMPVVNKRFSFSVELDKPKVGRIRTVMPDGSLCQLWTNLDFVPGETYRITTHNGYYDEDRDYEQRVGRYSGKSLLNKRQIAGNDDVDEIPKEFSGIGDYGRIITSEAVFAQPDLSQAVRDRIHEIDAWKNSLSPQQDAEIEQKSKALQAKMKIIEAVYEPIANAMSQGPAFRARLGFYVDQQCDEIIKQNKELDKTFQDAVKSIEALNPPKGFIDAIYAEGYREVLDVLTKQTNSFNEIFKARGSLSKKAQKAHKYIYDLTEKYMTEMRKHMSIK